MAKLTNDVKKVAKEASYFAVATATEEGDPHVIPVRFGKVLTEDEFLLMDVFMSKTVENINVNPRVAHCAPLKLRGLMS